MENEGCAVDGGITQLGCNLCYAVPTLHEPWADQMEVCLNSFVCQICGASFKGLDYLYWHAKNTHDATRKFQCKICSVIFKDPAHLTQHMKVHAGNTIFKCDICSASFSQGPEFIGHMKTHNDIRNLQCHNHDDIICQKHCKEDQMSTHFGVRKFHSLVCADSISLSFGLKQHTIFGHADVEKFKCEICDEGFILQKLLCKHMDNIHSADKFESMICFVVLTRCDAFIDHLYRMKNGNCELGAKICIEKSNLLRRMDIHTGLKNLQCMTSNISVTQQNHRTKHCNVHSCSDRGAVELHMENCMQNTDLVRHTDDSSDQNKFQCEMFEELTKRLGARPSTEKFRCELCRKNYSSHYNLAQHKASVHLGIKNFMCEYCEKSYTRKFSLTRHKANVHLGIKNFTCKICAKRFNQKAGLMRHINVHTVQKNFSCGMCGKAFKLQYQLTKHCRCVHADIKTFARESRKK